MGLDIRVNATVSQVMRSLKYEPGDSPSGWFEKAAAELRLGSDDDIGTRPGSYHGLHRVRRLYAMKKNWPVNDEGYAVSTKETAASHLIHHSDFEGWYLPDDFQLPILTDELSIGSSPRLLEELLEIREAEMDENERWGWNAVYAAAVASISEGEPIKFT